MSKLRALCRSSGLLPSTAYVVGETLAREKYICGSGFSDIYRGSCGGRLVAIKELRMHIDNRDRVLKASAAPDLLKACALLTR